MSGLFMKKHVEMGFLGLCCIDCSTFLYCWSDCFVQQQRCNLGSLGSRKFHWFSCYVDMQYLIHGYLFLSRLPLLQLPGAFINPIGHTSYQITWPLVWSLYSFHLTLVINSVIRKRWNFESIQANFPSEVSSLAVYTVDNRIYELNQRENIHWILYS